jgi:hypothetical protein
VKKGLSIVVMAEWYNADVMKKIKFFDDNTQVRERESERERERERERQRERETERVRDRERII